MGMAVGAVGIYILAADAPRDYPAASLRALERDGALIVFTMLGAALVFLVFPGLEGALAVLVCGFAALVLPGAFMAVIGSVFPSREAVEARYRVD
jgi:TRAP-type mannitol/chloroaromatic compound transport system permease large subunit